MINFMKLTYKLAIFVCAYALILYLAQENFYLHPDKEYIPPSKCGMPRFKEITLKSDDNINVVNWYAKGDSNKPILLFFHGNKAQMAEFAPALSPYIREGFNVMMAEYRGFGGTNGKFSQENMYKDASNIYDYLKNKLKSNDIYVFGFSLGIAPASYLAEAKKPKGVILGAPFYSLKEVAGEKNIPLAKYIIKYEMPSYKYVKNYKGDLLIVHGTDDMVIPAHHGKSLYELSSSNSKKLVLLPKTGHNDLFFNNKGAHPHIIDWINSH